MKNITVSTNDGQYVYLAGEASLDSLENSLVVHSQTGMAKFYWPNVIFYVEAEIND